MNLLQSLGIDLLPRNEIIALARELLQHLRDTSPAGDPHLNRLAELERRLDEHDAPCVFGRQEVDEIISTRPAM